MILLVLEFALNFVFTWVIPIARASLVVALLVKTRPSGSVVNAKSITLRHSNENRSRSSSVLY